jgi:hypothetical protein
MAAAVTARMNGPRFVKSLLGVWVDLVEESPFTAERRFPSQAVQG